MKPPSLFAKLALLAVLFCFSRPASLHAIEITGASLPGDSTFKILTGTISYNVSVRGTTEQTDTTYPYLVYLQGADFYENPLYIQLAAGTVTVRGEISLGQNQTLAATTANFSQTWQIPNDGTLHNIVGGYQLVVRFYPPGVTPTTVPQLDALDLGDMARFSGLLKIDVIPDLAVDTPAVTYPAAGYTYKGGEIIEFNSVWFNKRNRAEGDRQSRPLQLSLESVEELSDGYVADLRLTTNPVFDDTNNDDFLFSRLRFSADVPVVVDGVVIVRKVQVTDTPQGTPAWNPLLPASEQTALNPYGITGVTGSERNYTPQPDDGYLDLSETVTVTTEAAIPSNYAGEYFVALQVRMSNPDNDARPGNNTFVSNSANKLYIASATAPTTEPASVVSTDTGLFVQAGNAASDNSSVSEDGGVLVFSSRASNLLVPPQLAGGSTIPPEYATSNQQIFMKFRETGQMQLASRNTGLLQANADCANPSISADGRFVAYNSRASNLISKSIGGRSAIFVYNTQTLTTTVVSVRGDGTMANGDSFRPRLSQSGRFVVFESVATNLDSARTPTSITGQQIYLHDRDTDQDGVFDEPGAINTYLVSINGNNVPANGTCLRPVVNLEDSAVEIAENGGMYVAYTSFAPNLPSGTGQGRSLVYRVNVASDPAAGGAVRAIPSSVVLVSQNEMGQPPAAFGVDPVNAPITALADEASINGDGTQVAFMSPATNLVRNENDPTIFSYTPTYPNDPNDATTPVIPGVVPGGDYNRVPDIFVRNFNKPLLFPGNGALIRVSVSQQRVATGTLTFLSTIQPDNIPLYQPGDGDTLTISDGLSPVTFTFRAAALTPTDVQIGATIQATRDNLVQAINTSTLLIQAEATNPPNVVSARTGLPDPGTGYNPSIYLRSLVRGRTGNVPIVYTPAAPATGGRLVVNGMSGGGSQAEDDARAFARTGVAPIQGVPFGSREPSLDRTGRYVAFRTIATNLDVYEQADDTVYPTSPAEGELNRPLVFPTSNIYLHDRQADAQPDNTDPLLFDTAISTTRVSVNKFGYKTLIDGGQQSGRGAETSASSSSPFVSANGRFISFSSDASGEGGLIFGENNLTFFDNSQVRDVFLHDRNTVGENPVPPVAKPDVVISSPVNGLVVTPGTDVVINATATPAYGKAIASVELQVNGSPQGAPLTAVPFSWTYRVQTAGTFIVNVIATDSSGVTGNAILQINSVQPVVPVNPPANSNARFVVDYFPKIFLRNPTYAEYEKYLSMLNAGATQATVIVAMMDSAEFNAASNILYGYYLRMGVTPASLTQVRTFLDTMQTGTTNTTLLPAAMSAGVTSAPTNLPPSPYGATIGQAKVAQALIELVPNQWSNSQIVNLDNTTFMGWMLRSFNQPYLPQTLTNNYAWLGNQTDILNTIATFPTTTSAPGERFGYSYAFMSALYGAMPTNSVTTNNNLKATLASFNPTVKGIAVNYLLSSSNTWATNTPLLTTNLVQTLLPPFITNTGTNIVQVGVAVTNQIGGQNFSTNTRFSAVGLPPGLSINATNGIISGVPASTGVGTNKVFPATLFASNAPTLVGSNSLFYVVRPAAPVITSATNVTATNGTNFSYFVTAANFPRSFGLAGTLPTGLNFDFSTGQLVGVLSNATGIYDLTMSATNSGGVGTAPLRLSVVAAAPKPMATWLGSYGLQDPASPVTGDGYNMNTKFAFGMDPSKHDVMRWNVTTEGNHVVLRWLYRVDNSVSYTLKAADTLGAQVTWTTVDPLLISGASISRGELAGDMTDVPEGYEWIRVMLPRSTLGSKEFFKVDATIKP
jgi:hypothetical protein